jgi:hypothetical protein
LAVEFLQGGWIFSRLHWLVVVGADLECLFLLEVGASLKYAAHVQTLDAGKGRMLPWSFS